jgi:predicted AlkP superfamily pyrophosphatase or phosphodiesterase
MKIYTSKFNKFCEERSAAFVYSIYIRMYCEAARNCGQVFDSVNFKLWDPVEGQNLGLQIPTQVCDAHYRDKINLCY